MGNHQINDNTCIQQGLQTMNTYIMVGKNNRMFISLIQEPRI